MSGSGVVVEGSAIEGALQHMLDLLNAPPEPEAAAAILMMTAYLFQSGAKPKTNLRGLVSYTGRSAVFLAARTARLLARTACSSSRDGPPRPAAHDRADAGVVGFTTRVRVSFGVATSARAVNAHKARHLERRPVGCLAPERLSGQTDTSITKVATTSRQKRSLNCARRQLVAVATMQVPQEIVDAIIDNFGMSHDEKISPHEAT
ncbi:hypothetical protein C8J57DRAFT_1229262 [Mycena rebaudengoi]|nr:hypothetical protein C8J57DRAFT_1229262 [Mycena rebaudengoi]